MALLSSYSWAGKEICEIGRIDINSKKTKEAIEAILVNEPKNVACMLQLANIYLKQGELAKGFNLVVNAHTIEPEYVKKAPVAEILPFALKVAELKKQVMQTNTKELWNQLGDGYFETGIYDEAIEMYKKSLLVDKEQIDIRIKLALVLQKSTQVYSALLELERVLALDFENFYAHYYMGKIFMHNIQNAKEAKIHLEKAKSLWIAQKESLANDEYTTVLNNLDKELKELENR